MLSLKLLNRFWKFYQYLNSTVSNVGRKAGRANSLAKASALITIVDLHACPGLFVWRYGGWATHCCATYRGFDTHTEQILVWPTFVSLNVCKRTHDIGVVPDVGLSKIKQQEYLGRTNFFVRQKQTTIWTKFNISKPYWDNLRGYQNVVYCTLYKERSNF